MNKNNNITMIKRNCKPTFLVKIIYDIRRTTYHFGINGIIYVCLNDMQFFEYHKYLYSRAIQVCTNK